MIGAQFRQLGGKFFLFSGFLAVAAFLGVIRVESAHSKSSEYCYRYVPGTEALPFQPPQEICIASLTLAFEPYSPNGKLSFYQNGNTLANEAKVTANKTQNPKIYSANGEIYREERDDFLSLTIEARVPISLKAEVAAAPQLVGEITVRRGDEYHPYYDYVEVKYELK